MSTHHTAKTDESGIRATPQHHAWHEDIQALGIGVVLVTFGLTLFAHSQVLTGGLAGIALLGEYGFGLDYGLSFFVLNLPFYVLAFMRMGLQFTLKTFICVGLISILASLIPMWIKISSMSPLFAAVAGGVMIGMGMLSLLRHRTGVGGANILAQFLQDRGVIRAGYFQLIIDLGVMLAGSFILPLEKIMVSLIGAIVLNMVLAINHRPGRYMGFS